MYFCLSLADQVWLEDRAPLQKRGWDADHLCPEQHGLGGGEGDGEGGGVELIHRTDSTNQHADGLLY